MRKDIEGFVYSEGDQGKFRGEVVSPLQSVDSIQMRVDTRQKVTRMLWINQSVQFNAGTKRKGVGVYTQGRTKKEV